MEPIRTLSGIAAAVAVAVAVDAFGVGAPFLVVIAVPFVVALLLLRRLPRTGAAVAAVGCLLVAVTGAAYAISGRGALQSGFDALYVYVAAPLSLAGLAAAVGVLRTRRVARG